MVSHSNAPFKTGKLPAFGRGVFAYFLCLRLFFDVKPPHGDGVGHEGDGLDDHARVRAREDVIREPERRIGQVKQARAAHVARPERDRRHAHEPTMLLAFVSIVFTVSFSFIL